MRSILFKITVLSVLFISLNFGLEAQEYRHSAGFRLGNVFFPSYKLFVTDEFAFEVAGGLYIGKNKGTTIQLLGEYHKEFDVDGLSWYFGAGLGYGKFVEDTRVGLYGVAGIEYVLQSLPLNIALDLTPSFQIGGGVGLRLPTSIAVRYILGR